jgi:hypothetical protein
VTIKKPDVAADIFEASPIGSKTSFAGFSICSALFISSFYFP